MGVEAALRYIGYGAEEAIASKLWDLDIQSRMIAASSCGVILLAKETSQAQPSKRPSMECALPSERASCSVSTRQSSSRTAAVSARHVNELGETIAGNKVKVVKTTILRGPGREGKIRFGRSRGAENTS